jgi:hypothetical protein
MLVPCLAYSSTVQDMFLQNVSKLSTDYMALYAGRQKSSIPLLFNRIKMV